MIKIVFEMATNIEYIVTTNEWHRELWSPAYTEDSWLTPHIEDSGVLPTEDTLLTPHIKDPGVLPAQVW